MPTILIGMILGLVGVFVVTAARRPGDAVIGGTRPPRSALLHTGQSVAYLGVAALLVGALQLLFDL
ncbi:hypothetical protein [Aquihabitans sp. McL0605]|uniref:hypothetical protein n=1 Tax=Aquihabitans sp. McL0605 TaxID=3415671 RepID=UPI003CEB31E7